MPVCAACSYKFADNKPEIIAALSVSYDGDGVGPVLDGLEGPLVVECFHTAYGGPLQALLLDKNGQPTGQNVEIVPGLQVQKDTGIKFPGRAAVFLDGSLTLSPADAGATIQAGGVFNVDFAPGGLDMVNHKIWRVVAENARKNRAWDVELTKDSLTIKRR